MRAEMTLDQPTVPGSAIMMLGIERDRPIRRACRADFSDLSAQERRRKAGARWIELIHHRASQF